MDAETEPPAGDEQADVKALLESVIFDHAVRLNRSEGEIARGGMAVVEAAVDRTLGRRVALKLLHAEFQRSSFAVRSFIREAQITGQLGHPNIVPIHELDTDPSGRLFFTMKLVEGRTLLELLEQLRAKHDRTDQRGLRISTTIDHADLLRMIDVLLKVLDAVAFAHARGVVHCDIKSENVMVGDFGEVYLMDWGIAKLLPEGAGAGQGEDQRVRAARVRGVLPSAMDETHVVMGTPSYMPPEQARGERHVMDERADIFALGAMLFEILTGHPPYQGLDAVEELELAKACKSVLLPHLAIVRELRRIVSVAMHPDPTQRYPSIDAFRQDLSGFMRGGDNFPRRRFAKGQYLIREGDAGDAAYILVSGRCEICKRVNGQQESLVTVGPGDVFGETAILASSPRTASVRALTEVVAVIVTADVLERELDAMKPWMGSFIRALAQRFFEVQKKATDEKTTPKADPAQIANLALMTLSTWGRRDPEHGKSMSAIRLCESIAKQVHMSEDEVLKVLRQYSQFKIVLTHDRIFLRDARGLAKDLARFVHL